MGAKNIDWGKGIFRVWVVGSISWYVYIVMVWVFEPRQHHAPNDNGLVILSLLVAPIAVFILIKLISWALQSFKK
jgi:hypothetical protein